MLKADYKDVVRQMGVMKEEVDALNEVERDLKARVLAVRKKGGVLSENTVRSVEEGVLGWARTLVEVSEKYYAVKKIGSCVEGECK